MNVIRYPSDRLATLLRDQKVATMPQLKSALGTSVTFTVLRKLAPLGYRSSYSHSGSYFTLDSIAQYDERGLWSYDDIHFSRHGTLLNTAATLVTNAPAGYFTDELDAVVQVATKDALRHLVQQDRLYRGELAGRYLYCAKERRRRQEQWAVRQAQQRPEQPLQAAIVLFYSLLDEQQRRLYAGLESLEWGHGGDQRMAQLFGLDVDTVARGRMELLSNQVLRERVRRVGSGRPRVEKTPQILSQLRQLLRGDTAGDPTGRRGLWTSLRLEQISKQLGQLGLSACPNTVRRLLDQLDYALHANRKSLSGRQSPYRDCQFQYIRHQREQFTQEGLPIVSVDSKKKELVGRFKNAGRIWSREALPVNDHDFPSLASGVAFPRGLYDQQANRGTVLLGTSHDTAAFAVDALVDWWRGEGRRRYPQAAELLILADSGGSNGARSRLWKYALQEKLVDPYQLAVTVCHYPTGASKWNPIEHRVFSEMSKHCAGLPFTDYATMVERIAGTRTRTGLRVRCALNLKNYPTKLKVSDDQMRSLDLLPHPVLPQWNYTLLPKLNRN